MKKSTTFLSWSLLITLALIWGSSFILIKTGLKGFPATEVGALRIVSAAFVLLPFSVPRLRRIRRTQWLLLGIVGLCGSLLPAFLFAVAETELSSAVTGILNTLTPLFTMLIGILFFTQRSSYRTFAGLFLGFAGSVYLIIFGSAGEITEINYYSLLVVLATIFYGINLNIIKYRIPDLDARTITSISLFMAGILAAAFLFGYTDFVDHLTPETYVPLGAILLLGVLGTAVALILFNQLVKITTPIFTSSVTYLIPVVAVAWGLLDHEILNLHHFIGLMLVIAGVYIVNTRQRIKRPVAD